MHLSCAVCGEHISLSAGRFSCPNGSGSPHPLHKVRGKSDALPSLAELASRWFSAADEENSSLAVFRELMGSWQLANETAATSAWDDALARLAQGAQRLAGQGIGRTPLLNTTKLAAALGMTSNTLYLKNESQNLLGSHKSRHHMGAILYLELMRLHSQNPTHRQPLGIFSCGNAAMGSAAVAGAMGYPLYTFVPFGLNPNVESILSNLGAHVVKVRRDGQVGEGDPCFNRYEEALRTLKLVPFSCYGRDSWPSIEGAEAMGLEFLTQIGLAQKVSASKTGAVAPVASLPPAEVDALIVQVGGGGLAHALVDAIESALTLGLLRRRPRIYLVQTESAYPLVRGYGRLAARVGDVVAEPWEPEWKHACERGAVLNVPQDCAEKWRTCRKLTQQELENIGDLSAILPDRKSIPADMFGPWSDNLPESIADGILDDTTYDGFEIVAATVRSGGCAFTVSEDALRAAHSMAIKELGVDASPTGTAAIAGCAALLEAKEILPTETVALLLTGVGTRTAPGPTKQQNIFVLGANDSIASLCSAPFSIRTS